MSLRRRAVALIVALSAAGIGATSDDLAARAQTVNAPLDERPNILVIVTDDQRAGTMSVMPKTRDWFAAQGRRFPNAFATTPLCCPSRASIFTGRYAHNHGVADNRHVSLLVHENTMQWHLKQAGYSTAIVGKFLNGWDLPDPPPYFDRFSTSNSGYYSTWFNIDGNIEQVEDYSTDFMTQRAIAYLNELQVGSEPWFLYVAPYAPHSPYTPEADYERAPVPSWSLTPAMKERNRRDKPGWVRRRKEPVRRVARIRRKQLRTLMSVDDLVDQIFTRLQVTGEAANTLAFFVSDNGFLWRDHGLTSKRYPYTGSIKIPFLVRWPNHVQAGTRDRRFVANIDIAPTILEAAGIEPPLMDGRSLSGSDSRNRMLLEYSRYAPIRHLPSWGSIRTRRYQFTEYYRDDGSIRFREFYRLRKDPWQLRNVLRDGNRKNDPDVRALHRLLRTDRRCAGGDCP